MEITVDELPDGEVSPYLVEMSKSGDPVEVRGPDRRVVRVAARTQTEPVQLVAGGSGIVPLMAMLRARAALPVEQRRPMRLLYSVREPPAALYGDELAAMAGAGDGTSIDYVWTRRTPDGWPVPPGRLDLARLRAWTVAADQRPTCYVCGPTGFVEAAADLLEQAGHDPSRIRTERFGGT